MGVFLLAVGAVGSLTAIAGDEPEDLSQAGMNERAAVDFQKADVKLNAVYKKVMAWQIDAAGREKLKKAERLWVQFRDAECESEADEARGGTIAPMVYSNCGERLTLERTAQLADRLEP